MARNPVGVAAAKMQFFDRQVFAAYERAEKRALSKFGSYVRKDARQSMKRAPKKARIIQKGQRKGEARKKSLGSPKGTPPYTIKGQLKKFLYFLYDKYEQNVIIGPIKLASKSGRGVPVPGLHEHSGHKLVRLGRKQVVAHYPARPYMRPAGEKNVRKLGDLWKNAIK